MSEGCVAGPYCDCDNNACETVTVLRADLAASNARADAAEQALVWEDTPQPEDDAIAAAHPLKTDNHATYAEARRLVSARHSKGNLIDLVNWLLVRAGAAEAEAGALRACLVAYVEEYAGIHEDDCPEDDTCACPLVAQTNTALTADAGKSHAEEVGRLRAENEAMKKALTWYVGYFGDDREGNRARAALGAKGGG